MEKSEIYELISEVTEFNELSQQMKDQDLDKLLAAVVKLMRKPDVSQAAAAKLITQLQAFSTKCGVIFVHYAQWEKALGATEAAKRKRTYENLNRLVDKLVDALKYAAKSYG